MGIFFRIMFLSPSEFKCDSNTQIFSPIGHELSELRELLWEQPPLHPFWQLIGGCQNCSPESGRTATPDLFGVFLPNHINNSNNNNVLWAQMKNEHAHTRTTTMTAPRKNRDDTPPSTINNVPSDRTSNIWWAGLGSGAWGRRTGNGRALKAWKASQKHDAEVCRATWHLSASPPMILGRMAHYPTEWATYWPTRWPDEWAMSGPLLISPWNNLITPFTYFPDMNPLSISYYSLIFRLAPQPNK